MPYGRPLRHQLSAPHQQRQVEPPYASNLRSDPVAPTGDPIPHFERALELLADAGAWERGQALRRYGAYLLRSGQRAAAADRLAEAAALFEQLGAQGELAKVRCLLAGEDAP